MFKFCHRDNSYSHSGVEKQNIVYVTVGIITSDVTMIMLSVYDDI